MKHPSVSNIHNKVDAALHSRGGKNFMLYLLFVVVAFAFWMMLSLDGEAQKDFDIPLQITSVPDSVTIITPVPATISVNVRGKGSQLIRFTWRSVPVLKIDFKEFAGKEGHFYMSRSRLDTRLRDYFGTGITLSSIRPDSLSLYYTDKPGVAMKLRVQAQVGTDLQCIVSGPITANHDSVLVYSTGTLPTDLKYIETEPIVKSDLRDTTTFEVKVKPVKGVRIIPSVILVTVPVEPLISKKVSVPVDVQNVPSSEHVLTFPSKIEVSFLVPMSYYNQEFPVRAYADYEDTYLPGDKVPVKIGILPEYFHNISFTPDSVEYLIDKKSK